MQSTSYTIEMKMYFTERIHRNMIAITANTCQSHAVVES